MKEYEQGCVGGAKISLALSLVEKAPQSQAVAEAECIQYPPTGTRRGPQLGFVEVFQG